MTVEQDEARPPDPPVPLNPAAALSRGTNQTGLRLYNERLVLSLIRRHGALPKAEIARLTGLSAQTISVIMKQLESDGLLRREAPLRGRVGQPSVPYALDETGAYSLGLKIGRRSADLVLMNFVGEVLERRQVTYGYPTIESTLGFLRDGVAAVAGTGDEQRMRRTVGLGVAIPFELWSWAEQIGAPEGAMESWKGFPLVQAFGEVSGLPVHICNDATAACGAELIFGAGADLPDFLYIFVGTFVGGGLVLGGSLYPGERGNAGAVGSTLIPDVSGAGESPRQLIQSASIYILEKRMAARGLDPASLWAQDADWAGLGPILEAWIEEVARGLAFAIVSAVSVIDVEAVVVDGAFPDAVRSRLVGQTREALQATERTGLLPISVLEGSLGGPARVLGAASLPLMANFTRDSELLFKDSRPPAQVVER